MRWLDPEHLGARITDLDEVRFVAFCNALLGATAAAANIPRSCLSLTLNTKEPDGGIDARCEAAERTGGRLIPRANVIYQFKSGTSRKSIAKIVKEDIVRQKRVVAALRAGSALVYATAWNRGALTDEKFVAATRKAGIDVADDQVLFVGREVLAQELLKHPGLVATFLGIDEAALQGFDDWAAAVPFSNPFQSDATVAAQLADLRAHLVQPQAAVRVFGAAGDGKTRLVLESLRDSPLRESVLYAAQAEYVSTSVIAYLRRTPDVCCTLVVDEVDDEAAQILLDRLATRAPGVRLVLIGTDAARHALADSLQVSGLSADLLVATIMAIVPGLDSRAAEAIARDCERSPKLAVLISRSILKDPGLALSKVLGDRGVQSELDRYLPLKANEPDWAALSCACLLMRVGWIEEAEKESVTLFASRGLNPADARRHVEALHGQFGIAPLGGRFRYVSPAILADHLAAQQLGAWPRNDIADFFRCLTPSMQESFARRARRLSGVLHNRAAVEEAILGDDGPFRNFEDLESGGISFVLTHMAEPFPVRTLRALERCLGFLSVEQLKAAKNCRRDVVWALQSLLWPAATFEGASQLLVELAIAENETWVNNASGVWVKTFQTVLGATAAGGPARLRAVRRAAQHLDARGRVLAVRAIAAAFRSGHVSRDSLPPTDIAGMPLREWTPTTWGELFETLVAYLDVLAVLVGDADTDVSGAAAAVLGELAIEIVNAGQPVFDRWCALAHDAASPGSLVVRPVLIGIEAALRRWQRWLADEENGNAENTATDAERERHRGIVAGRLAVLRDLEIAVEGDGGFGTGLRSVLTVATRLESLEGDHALTVRAALREYATAAVARPKVMEPHWDWMLTDREWSRSERWMEFLGEADSAQVFAPVLARLAASYPRAVGWRSLYDCAFSKALGDETWILRRATELIGQGESSSACDLLLRSDYVHDRCALLQSMFARGLLPASRVTHVTYSGWLAAMSVEDVRGLIQAVEDAPQSANRTLLSAFVHHRPEAISVLRDDALALLATTDDQDEGANSVFDWELLAGRLVETAPLEVAKLALDRVGKLEVSHSGGLEQVLRSAWDLSDRLVFFDRIIAPVLVELTGAAWWQRKAIGQLPVHMLPSVLLLDWVACDPDVRARPLADVIGPPHSEPTELHVQLLEKYGANGVEAEYSTALMSGVFMGHESIWLRGKLGLAQRWASHRSPAMRDWGQRLAESLTARIRRAETEEAEERFR